ncbi:MAG: ArnT family glycosyltransferase, partial [Planctomycetota bacterium]
WAALPVAAADFSVPDPVGPDWWQSNVWNIGRRFFYDSGNDVQAMLSRGRAMIALLSTGLGVLVWLWSRRLSGNVGGLLSLVLYAFSPTMLAHGRLITTDTAASLFLLASIGGLWWVLHRVSVASVLLSSLALSGLLLSKFSGALILPMAGVLIMVRLVSRRPTTEAEVQPAKPRSARKQVIVWLLAAAAHLALAVSLIWAAYGFAYPAMRNAEPQRDRFFTPVPLPPGAEPWEFELETLGAKGPLIKWARDHKLLPESYLFGFSHALRHAQVRDAFLNGQRRSHGWWYFFPYCFAVKTPLPLFGLLSIGGIAWMAGLRRSGYPLQAGSLRRRIVEAVYRTAPLWVLFAVYWAFAVASHLNIGHRHILPIYPVLFILAGGAAADWRELGRARRWAVPGLTVLFVAASLRMFPDYLAYFNLLAGGPAQGYRHLVDSSLDWGQDLPQLGARLEAYRQQGESSDNNAGPSVYLSYFGTGHPPYYGIQARSLPSYPRWHLAGYAPLTGGVYCVSATTLQQVGLLPECRWTPALEVAYQDHRRRLQRMAARRPADGSTTPHPADLTPRESAYLLQLRFARLCAFLRQREPDEHVGYSILVYRLGNYEVRQAVDGQPAELIPDTPANLRRLVLGTLRNRRLASAATFYAVLLRSDAGGVDSEILNAGARLGSLLAAQGRTRQAISVFRQGLGHEPEHLGINNELAWLLATSKSAEVRDGDEALRRAQIANEASGGRDPSVLDTLAAAYAEAGRFEEALRCASLAITLAEEAGDHALAGQCMDRRDGYRAQRPYRAR